MALIAAVLLCMGEGRWRMGEREEGRRRDEGRERRESGEEGRGGRREEEEKGRGGKEDERVIKQGGRGFAYKGMEVCKTA